MTDTALCLLTGDNSPTTSPETAVSVPASGPASQAASEPAESLAYAPWQHRRGPAYPGDFWRSLGRDAKETPAILWDDTKATFTSPVVWVGFALAGASGIVLNTSETDARIERYYTRNGPQLDDFSDEAGEILGNPGVHFGIAGLMYVAGSAGDDTKLYETSKTAVSALAINGIVTMGLKLAVNNDSPNGEELAWPSGHTSSSFAFATVLAKSYGPWVGAPAYAAAAFIGYERIDSREHQFGDVISGALIGTVIGYAVGNNHEERIFGFQVVPYIPSDGGMGVAFVRDF